MALTVEDGTGLAGADSYVETTEVVTFADEYGFDKAGFVSLTQTQKDAACRLAQVVMEYEDGDDWSGERQFVDQALAWPRSGGLYRDGEAIDADAVPDEPKRKQSYLALLVGQGVDIAADADQTMMIEEVSAASGAGVKFSSHISVKQRRAGEMFVRRVLTTQRRNKWSLVP